MMASGKGMDQRRVDPAHRMRLIGRRDWQVAAVVCDRFLFVLYAVVLLVVMAICFPWPINTGYVTEPFGKDAPTYPYTGFY